MGITNVEFRQADVYELPFADELFDHVFVCFLLEHVTKPDQVLKELKQVLKTDGTITVVEGDHGVNVFPSESLAAQRREGPGGIAAAKWRQCKYRQGAIPHVNGWRIQ